MKILIIHTHYFQAGGEDIVVEQELALLKKHYIVESLFFQNKKEFKGALQFFFSICNLWAANKVRRKIKKFKPDVVHLHNWHFASGPWIIRTIKKMNIQIVVTLHNYRLICPSGILLHNNKLFLDSLKQSFPWSAVTKKVYRNSLILTFWLSFIVWFHKKIGTWQMVDTYVCLTPFSVDLFQSSSFGIPKNKFTVKPNFTQSPISSETQRREDYFLFVGRLSEEKGIKILLEVFKELPYTLKIAGDGPLKQLVEEASAKYSNIIYLGQLPKEKIIEGLQKAQALVFPSICFEGMPMIILEAFACSTPIISSNIGAMKSIIKHDANGFLFECENTKDFVNSINRYILLTKDEKYILQRNALESFKTNYSPEHQKFFFDKLYLNK